jgi:flagellar biosynthesis/type III secretory pathway chaperone
LQIADYRFQIANLKLQIAESRSPKERSGMTTDTAWETELTDFLTELSATQDELLSVLNRKLQLLATADVAGLDALAVAEQALAARLQACYQRRLEMLERAKRAGLPGDSLRALAEALPGERRKELQIQVHHAAGKSRLLQHQSLTNWVVVQRTLLHLSQLLEIIATGGRPRPTYGKEDAATSGGALLDRAA